MPGLVVRGATVYTMGEAGVVRADILVEDGRIAAVAPDLPVGDRMVIDAAGKVVTPGFVDAHSHIGGIASMEEEDLNEMSNPRTPELDALYGIDPESDSFACALAQGITTSCLIPGSGNVIGGWGMVFKSAGEHRLVRHPACLKAATGINPKGAYAPKNQAPMTRMSIAHLLRSYLQDVREYAQKKERAAAEGTDAPQYDLGLEHGLPVLAGEIPLKVHTYMQDMATVVELAREFDIRVTIDHAQGASDDYDLLCDPHVAGVIFGPTSAPLFPGEGGKLDPECCAGLDVRGVKVAVMTDGPVTVPNMLLFELAEAVRWGMDPLRALAMVTSNAADILGVADRVGRIEVGLDADLCLWSDLPSSVPGARLERVLVEGKTVYTREELS